MKQNILITGVSTGIGEALVKKFIIEDYFVIGSVRKESDAQELKFKYGNSFMPLIFDVTDYEAVEKASKELTKYIGEKGLFALINNAGIVVEGALKYISMNDLEKQFRVNVFGMLKVIQSFLPLLGGELNTKINPGRIINISSISGLFTAPFIGAYCASKHAVESLTDGLRRELDLYGIDVISVNPGAVKTPIWKKSDANIQVLENTDYSRYIEYSKQQIKQSREQGLSSESVANSIYQILHKKKPKTNTILMKGKLIFKLILLLPKRTQDLIIGKMKSKK